MEVSALPLGSLIVWHFDVEALGLRKEAHG
jgi:hypothetical protein